MPVESLDLDDLSMNGSESVDNILLDAEMMTGSFTEQEVDSAWDSIQNIVENKNVDKSRTFIVKVGMTTRDRVNHFIRLNKEKKNGFSNCLPDTTGLRPGRRAERGRAGVPGGRSTH